MIIRTANNLRTVKMVADTPPCFLSTQFPPPHFLQPLNKIHKYLFSITAIHQRQNTKININIFLITQQHNNFFGASLFFFFCYFCPSLSPSLALCGLRLTITFALNAFTK